MITGTTSTGFAFSIPEEARDDWELVEALVRVDKGDVSATVDALRLLMGDEGYRALKEHCRRGGRVSAGAMIAELREILEHDALKK